MFIVMKEHVQYCDSLFYVFNQNLTYNKGNLSKQKNPSFKWKPPSP